MTPRKESVAEHIRKVLSYALSFELSDPSLDGITLTHVKLSGDFQFADILFTLLDDNHQVDEALASLERAKGPLKRTIAQKVRMRRVPTLRFHFDEQVAAERRIGQILENLKSSEAQDD